MPELDVQETEEELVSTAQTAVSRCGWIVGECAAKWTRKYARGRTDADFAALVGLSADQVYQRRRVWETFGDVREIYAALSWSHFYVALNWDDAPECLGWAEENQAAVAEMKAWRRALRGEDLTQDAATDDWGNDTSIQFVTSEPTAVRDVDGEPGARGEAAAWRPSGEMPERPETAAAVARESESARSADPSAEAIAKRMISTLERVKGALTDEVLDEFADLPHRLRARLAGVIEELAEKAARLT
ncbi:MAG: hypothetical protein ACREJB_15940 [Planctomycetaceae bacterium]